MGSYKCICPRGFHTDPTGTMCLDADECTDDSRCQHGCQVKTTRILCNENKMSILRQLIGMRNVYYRMLWVATVVPVQMDTPSTTIIISVLTRMSAQVGLAEMQRVRTQ